MGFIMTPNVGLQTLKVIVVFKNAFSSRLF